MSFSPKIEHIYSNTIPNQSLVFTIRKIKNQKKWSKEEDELLIQLAEKYSEKNWKEISKQFSKKNSLQCFSRYKRIRPGIVKGSWKREEDIKIIELVAKYGKAWSKISKTLGTRNGKQIRDRYINVLDPEIKKGKFTEEEDNMLINLYYKHGPKWATIAKYYNKRTADMVKNRFHSSIKKRLGLDTSDRTGKVFEKTHYITKSNSPMISMEKTASSLSVSDKSNVNEIKEEKMNLNSSFLKDNIIDDTSNLNNIFNCYQQEDFIKAEEPANNLSQDEFNLFEDYFLM